MADDFGGFEKGFVFEVSDDERADPPQAAWDFAGAHPTVATCLLPALFRREPTRSRTERLSRAARRSLPGLPRPCPTSSPASSPPPPPSRPPHATRADAKDEMERELKATNATSVDQKIKNALASGGGGDRGSSSDEDDDSDEEDSDDERLPGEEVETDEDDADSDEDEEASGSEDGADEEAPGSDEDEASGDADAGKPTRGAREPKSSKASRGGGRGGHGRVHRARVHRSRLGRPAGHHVQRLLVHRAEPEPPARPGVHGAGLRRADAHPSRGGSAGAHRAGRLRPRGDGFGQDRGVHAPPPRAHAPPRTEAEPGDARVGPRAHARARRAGAQDDGAPGAVHLGARSARRRRAERHRSGGGAPDASRGRLRRPGGSSTTSGTRTASGWRTSPRSCWTRRTGCWRWASWRRFARSCGTARRGGRRCSSARR